MTCTGPNPINPLDRRAFLSKLGMGLGGIALADLMNPVSAAGGGILGRPHFTPKAKRVIYLFQSGGPSQFETFDPKPLIRERNGEELPGSVRGNQRLTGMSGNQASFPMAGSFTDFKKYGQSDMEISDLLPHTSKIADDICVIRSMQTDAINHDPAITFLQTGSQIAGRPCIGSWLNYGLGSDNENLPGFVVLITKGQGGQPLYSRLWGSGFLPSKHSGVQFRAGKEAVLYLDNPSGVSGKSRRKLLDSLRDLHEHQLAITGDPEINTRIAQFEMAYRMQSSVPEVTDLSGEPEHVLKLYGDDVKTPGTYAANCLKARRLAESGVKFIQLYHQGWDQHGSLPKGISAQCKETDQPSAGLIQDLKQRGMLDDTLVIWGGEFGRTTYSQGILTATDYGRDHHPRCFSTWMAGGGVKGGTTYGATDEFGYNVTENPVHVHDFHATLLHLLGIDHERLTYKFQGRRYRLTDVHGHIVKGILA